MPRLEPKEEAVNSTVPPRSSAVFAGTSSGCEYFDSDAHYQRLALGVLGELERHTDLVLLTGSPPPDADLFARHLKRECGPERRVRIIRGGSSASVVGLAVAADILSLLVIDQPADVAQEILRRLYGEEGSDDHSGAGIVLLGPDGLGQALPALRAKGRKSASPVWLRFRHLARHEVDPFIRFQMNAARLDQRIFKAPLVALIESYADGDPGVVNSLAEGILIATQGPAPESFAEVVADLVTRIGADTELAAEPTGTVPTSVPEEACDPCESASPVAPPEAAAPQEAVREATPSSPPLAAGDDIAVPLPEDLPAESSPSTPEPPPSGALEDGLLGSPEDATAQGQVTADTADASDPSTVSPVIGDAMMPVVSGAVESQPAPVLVSAAESVAVASTEARATEAPSRNSDEKRDFAGQDAVAMPREFLSEESQCVTDDRAAAASQTVSSDAAPVAAAPQAAAPEADSFSDRQVSAGATKAGDATLEERPEARPPERLDLESREVSLAAAAVARGEVVELPRGKSRTIGTARKWAIAGGIAAGIAILLSVALVHSREIGPTVSAWFAPAASVKEVGAMPLSAVDVADPAAQASAGEQQAAADDRPPAAVPQVVSPKTPPEADGDSGQRSTAPVLPARPHVTMTAHPASQTTEVAALPPARETTATPAPVPPPARDPVAVAPPRSEPETTPAPPLIKAAVPSPEAELFLQRGDQLMSQGDIVPARQFFERAAEEGAQSAAFRLAKSYDPVYLRRAGVRGIAADPAKAKQWYEQAIASGDIEAEMALLQLKTNYP